MSRDFTETVDHPLIGTLLADRYEVTSLLGEGGMGLVYKARHNLMKRWVAIKMIRADFMSDEKMVNRFQQEARAVSKLHHQNIVTVFDFGVTPEGIPYLVMDYLQGISLSELIAREGKLPLSRAMPIFMQACSALQHAHDRGIIHRDFKSSNIMICEDSGLPDVVKIVDFGTAKLLRPDVDDVAVQELTRTGEVFGSPLYMSPEQCRGQQLDERSDIYSFACVMYYALMGVPPFMGENVLDTLQKQIHDEAASMHQINPEIPEPLDSVVAKALRKDPELRYQNISALIDDLRSVMGGRDRLAITLNFKRPDLKPRTVGHNFESNVAGLMLIGALIVAATSFFGGLAFEQRTETKEINKWVDCNLEGDRARAAGNFKEAETAYQEAITEAMKFGKNDPRTAKSMVSLGTTFIADRQLARGEITLKRAETILEKCYGPNCSELSSVLLSLSHLYEAEGRNDEAAAAKKEALALLESDADASRPHANQSQLRQHTKLADQQKM